MSTKPLICGGYTCDIQDNFSVIVEQLELKGISAVIIEDKCKKITDIFTKIVFSFCF